MKLAVGVLPPISTSTQRVGYGRILSIVVIVIADRGRLCGARRDHWPSRILETTPRRSATTIRGLRTRWWRRMARRRNRWRLECRAAARSVRAAHGQRVRLIVKLDEQAELRAHGERNGRAREFFDLVPVRGQCRCDAAVNVFVPRRHIARAASRSAWRRAARASARFCWRFLCRPNPASAEFLDDVIKLGLDRFLVELVIAEIGICLAHGGL